MDYEKMIVGMTVARDTIPPEFAAFIRTTLPDELPKRLAEEQKPASMAMTDGRTDQAPAGWRLNAPMGASGPVKNGQKLAKRATCQSYFTISALDLIANTPLIALDRVHTGPGRLLAKAEFLQPGGSVKDRAARAILLAARRMDASSPALPSSR